MNVLYATDNCGMCQLLKSKLDSAGIVYSTFTDREKMLDMGFDAMPVLDIDGERLYFGAAVAYVNKKIKEQENE